MNVLCISDKVRLQLWCLGTSDTLLSKGDGNGVLIFYEEKVAAGIAHHIFSINALKRASTNFHSSLREAFEGNALIITGHEIFQYLSSLDC